MAKAIAPRVTDVQVGQAGGFDIQIEVLFTGAEVPSGQEKQLTRFNITGDESLNQLQTKTTDAVVAAAATIGVTVTRNQVIIPSLAKGG